MSLTSEPPPFLTLIDSDPTRDGVVASRSLVTIRWVFIAGQVFCLLLASYWFHADLNLPACLASVMTAAVMNLAAVWHRRQRARLNAQQATLYLAFDVLQLSLLLYLTGGLDNPFAMFMVAPVAVAAGLLRFRAVATLTALTVLCLTLNAIWHLPLPWPYGTLELPPRYAWVVWLALTLSVVFIAAYSWSVARETRRMRSALNAAQMELASANQMTAMGALAAAVAHELGTPLATISLVATEMLRETPKDSPLREDIDLLVSQSERCRRVLADFSRNPSSEGGDPYRVLPLLALVQEAAGPHQLVGKELVVTAEPGDNQPSMLSVSRRPELVHGLGNIIQNAFQFAKSRVEITVAWTGDKVRVTVTDDGHGFSSALLQKVGEPYISTRAHAEGGHMGLGVFIAKTLLERTGARVNFGNRPGSGARIIMEWPRKADIFVPQKGQYHE